MATSRGPSVSRFRSPSIPPSTIDTRLARDYVLAGAARALASSSGRPLTSRRRSSDDLRGHNMAKAAVEMGIWGLSALRAGKPLAETLGGTRDRVVTGISLGIQATPDALVTRAKDALAAGYRKIKVKIMPGKDVEYVAAVRGRWGRTSASWPTPTRRTRSPRRTTSAKLDAFNLLMIEQPLDDDDLVRHAALQRRLSDANLPRRIDHESRARPGHADARLWERSSISSPGRVGGFAAARAIHDLCEKANVPVWCGGMLESGIGRAYNVALASLPNFTLPGDLSPSARYWARDIVTPEWTMDAEGMVKVPRESPGIGVTVDVDRVEDLTTRRQVLS